MANILYFYDSVSDMYRYKNSNNKARDTEMTRNNQHKRVNVSNNQHVCDLVQDSHVGSEHSLQRQAYYGKVLGYNGAKPVAEKVYEKAKIVTGRDQYNPAIYQKKVV